MFAVIKAESLKYFDQMFYQESRINVMKRLKEFKTTETNLTHNSEM